MNKIKILNPEEIKMTALQQAEKVRFEKITQQIIEILVKESVLTSELPRIISVLTQKINTKIDNSLVDKILKL